MHIPSRTTRHNDIRAPGRVPCRLLEGALTLSAGVAWYPTHALGAAELVHQSSRALDEARSRGRDRVELAPDAN